tara:strand:- start:50 stop:736 length:687 start_codon:yes stop_codon:yes gene_type:complete
MPTHNLATVTKLVQDNTKKMLVLKVMLVQRAVLVQYSHVLVQAVENMFQLPVLKVLGILPGLILKHHSVLTLVRTVAPKQIAQPVRQQQLVAIGRVHSVTLVNILPVEHPVQLVVLTPTLLLERLPVRLIQRVVTRPTVTPDLMELLLQRLVHAMTVHRVHTLLKLQATVSPIHRVVTKSVVLLDLVELVLQRQVHALTVHRVHTLPMLLATVLLTPRVVSKRMVVPD